MLLLTESGDRFTVKCSCGCYSLSAHKPVDAQSSRIRCLICGAQAGLSDLLADCRVRSAHAEFNSGGRLS